MKYTEKTITTNNYTIVIRRPILTDSERQKREQDVITALERFEKEREKHYEKV